jgi:ethanolamine ammonia-lyase small subunit
MSDLATLRRFTPARVGLARAGSAVGTEAQLAFQLDHALARDAVHARMDVSRMLEGLKGLGFDGIALRSAVPAGAEERQVYLRRPDLGRRLDEASVASLRAVASKPEIVVVIADGLSALAVERHALAMVEAIASRLQIGAVCVVSQGRVAIGDEIGELLGASVLLMLIGERPGLSAADSLGVYITWQPRVGRTDAERNCISNIRHEGLSYAEAADRIAAQAAEAKRLGATGVALKAQPSNPLIA